ncbi:MAG: N-acetylglucosamine-6-phosphate deacetylase [Bacillota bacterium]|jgi:N-acetylglucosamine-6-phosphate deacetylase|nr:N-acetylglucosamine-6-phosphate deacetylase [Bacillota bacterium]NLL27053.1 N-acetylglucosamine-6-phosphate deacetylase [Erysipelotrichia bacterium]
MIIYCDRIYMEDGLKDGYLIVENGKFVEFRPKETNLKVDKDFSGYRIIPGIIDTHNHGCFGYDLLRGKNSSFNLTGYLKALASSGVTGVFPTCATDVETIEKIVNYVDPEKKTPNILGIHLEGPWGARVGEKGVNTGYPEVDMTLAKKFLKAANGKLKLIDIAPEVEGALEAIRFFTQNGVKVGAYHTNANYAQASAGIDAGITVATHLGNVMTGLHHRDIGTLGACLMRDEVDCEIICDGLHICFEMLELYFKVKDYSRFIMISDNVSFAGLPQGKYKGMTDDPESDRQFIYIDEKGFILSETGRISGSSKPIIFGIKNLVEKLNIPLEIVITMSSLNPAKKYGLDKEKGSIKIGKDGDFVVIDDNYDVIETYCQGNKIFDIQDNKILYNKDFIKSRKLS